MLLQSLLCLLISQTVFSQDGTFYGCDFIHAYASCDLFITDSYCGTDFFTYTNKCEFTKAHCKDPTIDLLHIGDCTDTDVATAIPVAGTDVILDFFCTSLSHISCPTTEEKVCASNSRTYTNYCEYEKAKCTHRNLSIVTFGNCVV